MPSVDNLLRLSELLHIHMEELLVKEHADNLFEGFEFFENDSMAFCKRMKAYYMMLAA